MLKFMRKQLEINNYAGPASPGADILDTLLEKRKWKSSGLLANCSWYELSQGKTSEKLLILYGQSELLLGAFKS